MALVDDDGFSEAILRAHAVVAPEELQEAEAAFEHRRAITERSFDRLPEAEARMRERNGARARDPLTRRATVADEVGETEIEEEEEEIAGLVEVPYEVNVLFVEHFDTPEDLRGSPENDSDEDVDGVAKDALRESGEGHALELMQAAGFVRVKTAGAGLGFRFGGCGHGFGFEGSTMTLIVQHFR
jgi:hypothetical protein